MMAVVSPVAAGGAHLFSGVSSAALRHQRLMNWALMSCDPDPYPDPGDCSTRNRPVVPRGTSSGKHRTAAAPSGGSLFGRCCALVVEKVTTLALSYSPVVLISGSVLSNVFSPKRKSLR